MGSSSALDTTSAGIHRRLPPIEVSPQLISRFWKKVDRKSADECWPWIAGLRNGYGCIKIGRVHSAHRVAYVIQNGEPREGLVIAHKCDNRQCCNPAHLEAIAQGQNIRDAFARLGRIAPKGGDIANSVLAEEQVHLICKTRVQTGLGWMRISKLLGLNKYAVKQVIERHTWLHISRQYDIRPIGVRQSEAAS